MTRLAVVTAVALALGAALYRLPGELRAGYHRLDHSPGSSTVRELGPVESFPSLSPDIFLLAAKAIPINATYAVVVGDDPPTQPILHDAIPPLAWYWLLPRRWTADPSSAQWILSYRQPVSKLGVRVARVVPLGPDARAVEVRP